MVCFVCSDDTCPICTQNHEHLLMKRVLVNEANAGDQQSSPVSNTTTPTWKEIYAWHASIWDLMPTLKGAMFDDDDDSDYEYVRRDTFGGENVEHHVSAMNQHEVAHGEPQSACPPHAREQNTGEEIAQHEQKGSSIGVTQEIVHEQVSSPPTPVPTCVRNIASVGNDNEPPTMGSDPGHDAKELPGDTESPNDGADKHVVQTAEAGILTVDEQTQVRRLPQFSQRTENVELCKKYLKTLARTEQEIFLFWLTLRAESRANTTCKEIIEHARSVYGPSRYARSRPQKYHRCRVFNLPIHCEENLFLELFSDLENSESVANNVQPRNRAQRSAAAEGKRAEFPKRHGMTAELGNYIDYVETLSSEEQWSITWWLTDRAKKRGTITAHTGKMVPKASIPRLLDSAFPQTHIHRKRKPSEPPHQYHTELFDSMRVQDEEITYIWLLRRWGRHSREVAQCLLSFDNYNFDSRVTDRDQDAFRRCGEPVEDDARANVRKPNSHAHLTSPESRHESKERAESLNETPEHGSQHAKEAIEVNLIPVSTGNGNQGHKHHGAHEITGGHKTSPQSTHKPQVTQGTTANPPSSQRTRDVRVNQDPVRTQEVRCGRRNVPRLSYTDVYNVRDSLDSQHTGNDNSRADTNPRVANQPSLKFKDVYKAKADRDTRGPLDIDNPHADSNPHVANQPSLKLADVYKNTDDRDKFDANSEMTKSTERKKIHPNQERPLTQKDESSEKLESDKSDRRLVALTSNQYLKPVSGPTTRGHQRGRGTRERRSPSAERFRDESNARADSYMNRNSRYVRRPHQYDRRNQAGYGIKDKHPRRRHSEYDTTRNALDNLQTQNVREIATRSPKPNPSVTFAQRKEVENSQVARYRRRDLSPPRPCSYYVVLPTAQEVREYELTKMADREHQHEDNRYGRAFRKACNPNTTKYEWDLGRDATEAERRLVQYHMRILISEIRGARNVEERSDARQRYHVRIRESQRENVRRVRKDTSSRYRER